MLAANRFAATSTSAPSAGQSAGAATLASTTEAKRPRPTMDPGAPGAGAATSLPAPLPSGKVRAEASSTPRQVLLASSCKSATISSRSFSSAANVSWSLPAVAAASVGGLQDRSALRCCSKEAAKDNRGGPGDIDWLRPPLGTGFGGGLAAGWLLERPGPPGALPGGQPGGLPGAFGGLLGGLPGCLQGGCAVSALESSA
mmetsp:Transcript_91966/g.297604  ORF Transcript_91966/g.297604 Transcript_91966/m.297604 type:complete len:200 (+) Transcript_91966:927-1526(+)